jgi:hypothetical protein
VLLRGFEDFSTRIVDEMPTPVITAERNEVALLRILKAMQSPGHDGKCSVMDRRLSVMS